MDSLLPAMVIFAVVGAATPGPVNILATSTAVQYGVTVASRHVLGASLTYALIVLVSGSILQKVALWVPELEASLQWIGSIFLIYLAYKIYTSSTDNIVVKDQTRSGWINGSLMQLLNPKAWLVAMSGVSLYVIGQAEQQKWLVIFMLVSLFACIIGVGFWAMAGGILARYLREPVKQAMFNRTMAIVLLISVIMIWLD